MSTDRTEQSPVGELPERRQVVVTLVGVVFWSWLLLRWAAHNGPLDRLLTGLGRPELIESKASIASRQPWVPPESLEAAATQARSVAEGIGPVGQPVEWLAWLLELLAFAAESAPALAAGAFITVYLTLASMLLGLLVAIPLSVSRVYGGRLLATLSLAYTELIRGTPLLAQLFLFYYALPLAGWFDELWFVGAGPVPRAAVFVAVVGFTVNSSAYQAEYIRSALLSVEEGQLLAGRSVGLSKLQGIRHIVLPQGLRYAIPGWTNEFVYLIKYSALAAFITVPEMFGQARIIVSDTFRVTDMYIILAVLYLALVLTTTLAMSRLERAVSIPGLGTSAER